MAISGIVNVRRFWTSFCMLLEKSVFAGSEKSHGIKMAEKVTWLHQSPFQALNRPFNSILRSISTLYHRKFFRNPSYNLDFKQIFYEKLLNSNENNLSVAFMWVRSRNGWHKMGFPPIIGFGRIIFSYDSSSDIVLRLFDNVSHVACAAKKYFQFNLLVD